MNPLTMHCLSGDVKAVHIQGCKLILVLCGVCVCVCVNSVTW